MKKIRRDSITNFLLPPEHIIKATRLMLNNPSKIEDTYSEKEWRTQAPPTEGWFLPRDFTRGKNHVCNPNATSILRRDLQKFEIIEMKPLTRTDDKNRSTKLTAIRLRNDEPGVLLVLALICEDEGLYAYFTGPTMTDYRERHNKLYLNVLGDVKTYAKHLYSAEFKKLVTSDEYQFEFRKQVWEWTGKRYFLLLKQQKNAIVRDSHGQIHYLPLKNKKEVLERN